MTTPSSSEFVKPDRQPVLPIVLFAVYGVIWLVLAVHPVSRQDWLLENLLVFVAVPFLWITQRRYPFSNTAYVLLALFLILHAVGAHYTYSLTPVGDWLRDWMKLDRNHYDRLVHFAFGLCLTLPVSEVLLRLTGLQTGTLAVLAVSVILAGSGLYEIIEAVVAMIVDPELGAAYTGTQGDEWDSQKDMLTALTGSLITTVVIVWRHRRTRNVS